MTATPQFNLGQTPYTDNGDGTQTPLFGFKAGGSIGITPTDRTIASMSGSSQQIMAANTSRHSLIISNTGTAGWYAHPCSWRSVPAQRSHLKRRDGHRDRRPADLRGGELT